MWVFPKIEVSQIIYFNRVFHYKPSILGYHYFWKYSCSRRLEGFHRGGAALLDQINLNKSLFPKKGVSSYLNSPYKFSFECNSLKN